MIPGSQWRKWRERKGLSLREFAKQMDVSPTYVSGVETNQFHTFGYSRITSMRAILVLGLNRQEAELALGRWLAFHRSEVAAIEEFLCSIAEPKEGVTNA